MLVKPRSERGRADFIEGWLNGTRTQQIIIDAVTPIFQKELDDYYAKHPELLDGGGE